MKNVSNLYSKIFLYLSLVLFIGGFTGCNNDDDVGVLVPTGSIEVEDQTISQNQVRVDRVISSTDGFLIARHISETGIILAQEDIDQGTHEDIVLQLDDQGTGVNLEDGDAIVISLYADSNNDGIFNANIDQVLATETVFVSSPTFSVADQAVVDNTITVENISTSEDGFLVVFGENEDGTINEDDILGRAFIAAGQNQTATITFDEGRAPVAGTSISTRLHRDINRDSLFDPAIDTPETFNFNAPNNTVFRRSQIL